MDIARTIMDMAPLLSAEQIAFMQGPVSIIAASHDAALKSNLVRAVGCSLGADGNQLRIYVTASQAGTLLADLRANRALAAVFCRPSTDHALQIKAVDAAIIPTQRDDVRATQRYRDMMVGEIAPLGFPEPVLHAIFSANAADVVVVRCTPTAVFEQTPGPNAGNALAVAGAPS